MCTAVGKVLKDAVNLPCCNPELWGLLGRYYSLRGQLEGAKEALLKQVRTRRAHYASVVDGAGVAQHQRTGLPRLGMHPSPSWLRHQDEDGTDGVACSSFCRAAFCTSRASRTCADSMVQVDVQVRMQLSWWFRYGRCVT